MKSKGLGDSIEKITTATGIKAAVDFISEKLDIDCGCDKRKEALNKLFPYRQVECLNEDEYIFLNSFSWDINILKYDEQVVLMKIYNRIFKEQRQMTSCSPCWNDIISKLKTVYLEYKNN